MRYRLFPSLTFLSYLKKLHVYYSPARIEKADVARRLIIFASSQKIKQRYPLLTVTWELLAYGLYLQLFIIIYFRFAHTCIYI